MALAASGGDSAEARLADRRLVEAHRAGDPHAFAEIVQTHYASLLAYARRRLRHDQDAEDAVQETLLRAFRHLRRFGADGEWRLGPWLQKILANVCHDAAARRLPTASLTEEISDSHADADVGSTSSDPVALAAVRDAIATLPVNQRRAFELRIVDDLPYPEVALQMGITEDNARARVTRARSQLRRLLDGNGAVTGTLGVLPLYFVTSVRAAVRRVLYGADDHSARSAASITATSTGTAASAGAAPGALSTATSPISSGMQLVGQLTASPVGQVAVAASAAGGGKGSVVIGLVASLATAGGLSVPAVSAISASPAAASQPVSAQAAGAPRSLQGTGTALSARLAAHHASLQSSVSEAPVGPGAGSGAASSSTGGQSTGGASSVSAPSWVALAASASASAAASAGSASSSTAATPATSAGSAGAQTSTSSSASSTSSASGVSGGTSGAAGAAAPAGGTGTSASTSSGSGSTGATQLVPALPTGTCSTVPGFSGVTADATVPPLTSAAITSILSTGAVHLASPTGSPAFVATASAGSTASKATPVQVVVGTCLEQGGSLLAVDLTSADGTEAQLVGSLVAGPMQTGTDGVSYLFRGTVQQVSGGKTTGGPLPWGLPRTFVAELQVAQPADTATLTVAFMDPLAGPTASTPSLSSTSSASRTASGPSDASTSPGGTGAPVGTGSSAGTASGTGSGSGTPGGTGSGSGARATSTPADGETATTRSPIPTSPAEHRSGTGSTVLRVSTSGSGGSGGSAGSSLDATTSPTASS